MTRSFANTRRVLCAGLLCAAALYFAPPAHSQSCTSPGNAGIDQYCDPLDPPPGAHRTPPSDAGHVPGRTRQALEHGSVSAQGALALSRIAGVADPIGPAARGRSGRTGSRGAGTGAPPAATVGGGGAAADSGPTVGGGFVAVLVALALAMGVVAFVVHRGRRSG